MNYMVLQMQVFSL